MSDCSTRDCSTRGIGGRVAWHDGTDSPITFARYVNGVERKAVFVELDEAMFYERQTCRLEKEPGSEYLWWCSHCEFYHSHLSDHPWEYCPRCGAKVVSGE